MEEHLDGAAALKSRLCVYVAHSTACAATAAGREEPLPRREFGRESFNLRCLQDGAKPPGLPSAGLSAYFTNQLVN
jgi:hypothetical protein